MKQFCNKLATSSAPVAPCKNNVISFSQKNSKEREEVYRTSSTTTTVHTESGVLWQQPLWELLNRTYFEYISKTLPSFLAMFMFEMFRDGFELSVFEYALEQTMLARRPSPHYLMAILKRLKFENKRYILKDCIGNYNEQGNADKPFEALTDRQAIKNGTAYMEELLKLAKPEIFEDQDDLPFYFEPNDERSAKNGT